MVGSQQCSRGRVVRILIGAGADVDKAKRGPCGSTPPITAAKTGHEGVGEELIKAGRGGRRQRHDT